MGAAPSADARAKRKAPPAVCESSKLLRDAVASDDRTLFGGWISWSDTKKNSDIIWAVFFFMVCSSSMLLVNKLIMGYWHLPVTVTLIQLLFACVSLCFVYPQLHVGSWHDAWRWLRAVPLLFAIMLATSMLALK